MNRTFVSLFLLLVFVLAWLKPAIPFIHFELNKFYIQKYLCEQKDKPKNTCKGKCHLRKQLKKMNKQETNNQFPLPLKPKFDDFPVFEIVNQQINVLLFKYRKFCFKSFNFYDYRFSKNIFHPPKV